MTSKHPHDKIAGCGGDTVIAPKRSRKLQRPYASDLYKERHLIARLFSKRKPFRRAATRYDKLPASFMGFGKPAAIALWLR